MKLMAFAEVIEYAKWLGMNPENEEELLWIAREGIKVFEHSSHDIFMHSCSFHTMQYRLMF